MKKEEDKENGVISDEEEDEEEEEYDEDDDDEEDEYEDEDDEEEYEEDLYRRKYRLLSERIEAIQQDNDRLASRISEVGRWCRRGANEREFLIRRLDSHGDNFRNVPIIVPFPGESIPDKNDGSTSNKGRKRKKPGKKRAKPDPNCPKRPQNPFFQFCQENRARVSKEYLDLHRVTLTKKELTKVLGSKWNEMTSTDKQVYYELYEREKVRYGERLQKYKEESSWNKETPQ